MIKRKLNEDHIPGRYIVQSCPLVDMFTRFAHCSIRFDSIRFVHLLVICSLVDTYVQYGIVMYLLVCDLLFVGQCKLTVVFV